MKVWLLEIWHVFDFFGSFISRFISGCAATLGIVLDNFLLPSNLVEASLSCLFVLKKKKKKIPREIFIRKKEAEVKIETVKKPNSSKER